MKEYTLYSIDTVDKYAWIHFQILVILIGASYAIVFCVTFIFILTLFWV